MKYNKLLIISIVTIALVFAIAYILPSKKIPIVTIGYNNLFFMRNFIDQLKRFDNPIIILDNKSTFEPMLEYYDEITRELGSRIEIRRLNQNYGSNVTAKLKHTLPSVFILSDCDLQLNPRMPKNFSDILLNISNKYNAFKVGLALNITDKDKFLDCKNYTAGQSIYDWEKKYWNNNINDSDYELYNAPIDTTFSLVNYNYQGGTHIRVAGDFTAKHLPWYKNYMKQNIPPRELQFWKQGNHYSSILISCITDL
jgi:hypothetical protein